MSSPTRNKNFATMEDNEATQPEANKYRLSFLFGRANRKVFPNVSLSHSSNFSFQNQNSLYSDFTDDMDSPMQPDLRHRLPLSPSITNVIEPRTVSLSSSSSLMDVDEEDDYYRNDEDVSLMSTPAVLPNNDIDLSLYSHKSLSQQRQLQQRQKRHLQEDTLPRKIVCTASLSTSSGSDCANIMHIKNQSNRLEHMNTKKNFQLFRPFSIDTTLPDEDDIISVNTNTIIDSNRDEEKKDDDQWHLSSAHIPIALLAPRNAYATAQSINLSTSSSSLSSHYRTEQSREQNVRRFFFP